MLVSKYKNALASMPQDIELVKIANKIRSEQDLYEKTKVYRQMVYPKRVSGYKEYKLRNFQAITPAALMYAGKTRNHIVGLTGLCFLDIDRIRKEVRMQFLIDKLRQDNHVMLAYKSVSGRGLHVLIHYRIQYLNATLHTGTRGSIVMHRLYRNVFDHIAAEYEKKLFVVVDKHARSPEHTCVLCHDQDCYFNPDAEPISIPITPQLANCSCTHHYKIAFHSPEISKIFAYVKKFSYLCTRFRPKLHDVKPENIFCLRTAQQAYI